MHPCRAVLKAVVNEEAQSCEQLQREIIHLPSRPERAQRDRRLSQNRRFQRRSRSGANREECCDGSRSPDFRGCNKAPGLIRAHPDHECRHSITRIRGEGLRERLRRSQNQVVFAQPCAHRCHYTGTKFRIICIRRQPARTGRPAVSFLRLQLRLPLWRSSQSHPAAASAPRACSCGL